VAVTSSRVAISPDTKDWTWVITRSCPECGFDPSKVEPSTLGSSIRENAAAWTSILRRDRVARRPNTEKWSALEYGCHVRDVFRTIDGRLVMMLTEDSPTFPNWDQDATAINDRYRDQDAVAVLDELEAAARTLADRYDSVVEGQWDRRGVRSNGSRFTVATLGVYCMHDVSHHLWDVS
jgi:hypothetical protein